MNKQELAKKFIFEALKKFGGLTKNPPMDDDLWTYAELLSKKFEFKQVTWALSQYIEKGGIFFPSCGDIFKMLSPKEERKEDKAPRIVIEMITALRNYSQHDEERMIASVSPEARLAFRMLGSTQDIRISEEIEIVKAQLERLVKSVLSNEESIEWRNKLATTGIKGDGFHKVDFADISKQLLS